MELRRFGHYSIEARLGSGGMGVVYRARDTRLGRVVALKVLPDHLAVDAEFRARFERESRMIASIQNHHIVPIHGYGEIEGSLYLDMRLVEGDDLAGRLARQQRLSSRRAVHIVDQLAHALSAAHDMGVVHRDVKPSNVLMTTQRRPQDDDFVYLVDFGLARPIAPTDEMFVTLGSTVLGTFDYMAPEMFLGGVLSPLTDVYSLTCVLYECVTGQRPFPSAGSPDLMEAHASAARPRPSRLHGDIPVGLDDVIARGMAIEPRQRFASVDELAAASRTAIRPPPAARYPGVGATPAQPDSRPPIPVRSPRPVLQPPRPQPARPAAQPAPPVAPPVRPPAPPVRPPAPPVRPPAPPVRPVARPLPPVAQPLRPVARPVPPVAQPVRPAVPPPDWRVIPSRPPAHTSARPLLWILLILLIAVLGGLGVVLAMNA